MKKKKHRGRPRWGTNSFNKLTFKEFLNKEIITAFMHRRNISPESGCPVMARLIPCGVVSFPPDEDGRNRFRSLLLFPQLRC